MPRTGYFDTPLPRFLAHRGLSDHRGDIDENSMEAFLEALKFGATHIESDVHSTNDDVAVLFHDEDLKRVADLDVRIDSLSFAELSEVRLRNGGKIPSLSQALELGVRLNLDIKSRAAIFPTVREIERHQAHDRVLVSSFSSLRRKTALASLTRPVATSASSREVALAWLSHQIGGLGFSRIVRDLDAFQIPPSQGPLKFATEKFINRLKSHNIEVHFWTVNEISQMQALLAMGADGIVSDRIDLLV